MTSMHYTLGVTRPSPDNHRGDFWWEQAACAGDELFQRDDKATTAADETTMRNTCRGCPVAAQCLTDTLKHKDGATFRSGWTAKQRANAEKTGRTLTPGGPAPKPKRSTKSRAHAARDTAAITIDPTKRRTFFTPEEDDIIRSGLPALDIAQQLGRSYYAITSRRRRLTRDAA